MAGYFELVDAPDGGYRIRMLDGAGSLMAVSVTFPTKRAAVAGIAQAREIAGTGLIRDRSAGGQAAAASGPALPGAQTDRRGHRPRNLPVRRVAGGRKAGAGTSLTSSRSNAGGQAAACSSWFSRLAGGLEVEGWPGWALSFAATRRRSSGV